MTDINLVLLASRWIHISAAIVVIGGAVFMRFTLLPSATRVLDDAQHERLREAVRTRWARFVYVCIALLLLSGTFNFVMLAMPPKIDPLPYHPIFGVKFLAAITVFFLGSALVGTGPAFAVLRLNNRKWLSVIVALAALIVLVSGTLNQIRSKAASTGTTPEVSSVDS